jgi:hypothetical protein
MKGVVRRPVSAGARPRPVAVEVESEAVCFFKRIGRELRFEIDRLSFGRRRPNNCLEDSPNMLRFWVKTIAGNEQLSCSELTGFRA